MKQSEDEIANKYPSITAWVRNGGYIEIGQTSYELPAFVKALDEGGMIWEGELKYDTMDEAFQALESGIAAFLKEQGIK